MLRLARRRHLVALSALAVLLVASAASAVSLGPPPTEAESRCANVSVSPHVLHAGQKLHVTVGPPTAACGGPSSTVKWAFDEDDLGLRAISACAPTTPQCTYRVYLPGSAEEDRWTAFTVTGSSPDGGWGSSDAIAILSDGKHALLGTVTSPQPDPHLVKGATVHLKGRHGSQTTTTGPKGDFSFPVANGTYSVSTKLKGKTLRKTVKVAGRDAGVGLDFSLQ